MASSFYGGDYFGGEFFSGVVVDPLIGRKYPSRRRRGIYHPRKREETVEIPVALKELEQERLETLELLEVAQNELRAAELIADNAVNRSIRVEQLSLLIKQLEWDLRMVKDEEEFMMLLSFVVLDN